MLVTRGTVGAYFSIVFVADCRFGRSPFDQLMKGRKCRLPRGCPRHRFHAMEFICWGHIEDSNPGWEFDGAGCRLTTLQIKMTNHQPQGMKQ